MRTVQNTASQRKARRRRRVWPMVTVAALVGVFSFLAGRASGGASSPTPSSETAPTAILEIFPAVTDTTPLPSAAVTDSGPGTEDAWNLRLVNPWNPLPEDYDVSLTRLNNGQAVDSRCYPELQAMMDACRAEGLSPVICSSYRTWEKQEALYTAQVDKLTAQGYSDGDARAEAANAIAVPGTSEHQLGLAVDIVDLDNQNLTRAQEDTPVQRWLMAHCWEYGFILRYPDEKSEVTGIIYEPWHYRYVGKEAAREIAESGLCLEEYLSMSATTG